MEMDTLYYCVQNKNNTRQTVFSVKFTKNNLSLPNQILANEFNSNEIAVIGLFAIFPWKMFGGHSNQ